MTFLFLFPLIIGPILCILWILILAKFGQSPKRSLQENASKYLFAKTYGEIMDTVFELEKTVETLEHLSPDRLITSSEINLDYFYTITLDSAPSKAVLVMYAFPYAVFHLKHHVNTKKILVAIVRDHEFEDITLPVKYTSFEDIFNEWLSFMRREGHILTYQEDFSEIVEKDLELLEEALKFLKKIKQCQDSKARELLYTKQQTACSLVEDMKTILWLNSPPEILEESFIFDKDLS